MDGQTFASLSKIGQESARRAEMQRQQSPHSTARPKERTQFDLFAQPPRSFLQDQDPLSPDAKLLMVPGYSAAAHATSSLTSSVGTLFTTIQQSRSHEDRLSIYLADTKTSLLVSIFDGHSARDGRGWGSCDLAQQEFGASFLHSLPHSEHPVTAFRTALGHMQRRIAHSQFKDGTTVTSCYIHSGNIFGITLGDSPATLYWIDDQDCLYLCRLSYIETWTDPQAQQRVAGHTLFTIIGDRLFNQENGRALAVTRGLGDIAFYPAVTQDPIPWEVGLQELNGTQYFLLMATDGLAGFLDEREAGQLIHRWLRSPEAYPFYANPAELVAAKARELAHAYCAMRKIEDRQRAIDDITVALLFSPDISLPPHS